MIDRRNLFAALVLAGGLTLSLPAYGQFSTPMRDVDNGARQPVNFGFSINVNAGSGQGFNNTAVVIPAGKRLVIETIGFQGQVVSGEIGFLNIQLTAGATFANHVMPSVKLTSVAPSSDYVGGIGSFKMYADAGSTVTVVYNRGTFASGGVSMSVCITGYFVNLP